MNYYRHHIGDHLQETAHLSLLEKGIYGSLMDMYYSREGPLPANVGRLIGARSPEELKALEDVLNDYFVLQDDGWHNGKFDEVICTYRQRGNKNAQNGRNGGRPPKTETKPNANPTETDSVISGNPNETQTKPNGLFLETQTKPNANPTETQTKPPLVNHKPITNKKPKEPPIPPVPGGNADKSEIPKPVEAESRRRKREAVTLTEWLEGCKQSGVAPVPDDDPVFAYAAETGIPIEFLRLHWREFKARYALPDAKKYKDWRAVHRKCVRGCWLRLWRFAPDGSCVLTTQGEQARRCYEKRHDGSEIAGQEWWAKAGFESRWDAENAGCTQANAANFRDGAKAPERQPWTPELLPA